MIAGLELLELAYLAAVIGIGAFVRGVTGFGSSMIYVVGLTFAMPAAEAVPVILMLEVITSAGLAAGCWRHVEWRSVGLLLVACFAATPIGLAILNFLEPAPMQALIALVVLVVCVMLRQGFRLKAKPGPAGTLAVGAFAGLLTGTTSTGGPPIVIYYASSPIPPAVLRASLIVFLGLADLGGSAMAAYDGLIVEETVLRTLLCVPPMILAAWIGTRVFNLLDADRFRQWVIVVLAALSVVSLAKALSAML